MIFFNLYIYVKTLNKYQILYFIFNSLDLSLIYLFMKFLYDRTPFLRSSPKSVAIFINNS